MSPIRFRLAQLVQILALTVFSAHSFAVDPAQVEKDLQGPGAVGWIHGAVASQNIFVFTVRNPQNFFDYAEFSLVTDSSLIQAQLQQLSRHDKVRLKGDFLQIPAPQKHIDISELEVIEPYNSGIATKPYEYEAKIPEDLLNSGEAHFLVHAVAAEGAVLVLEYKDAVVPVFVQKTELSKNLARGDLIDLHYTVQKKPTGPVHLDINESLGAKALQVEESILALNQKPVTVQGRLVLFPKSPEIMFNIFAVEQPLNFGLRRQYTLVNFEDPTLFEKIRAQLQAAWDRHPQFINGRNKLISTAVQVQVKGLINEVDPSQANPQILIHDLKDLQILE